MPIRSTGHYVPGSLAGSRYQAFVPDPLPPQPPLALSSPDLIARKERADQALGRLDGITLMLPDPELFLYQYVRKEALLSSQIEAPNRPCPTCCCSSWTKRPACRWTMSRKSQITSLR